MIKLQNMTIDSYNKNKAKHKKQQTIKKIKFQ